MAPQEPPPRRATVGAPNVQGKPPTNIDRRKCHRVVPMKVMCFGLSRTGTASMRQALLDLGYDETYHYTALFNENPPDVAMWIDAVDAKYNGRGKLFEKKDWDQLLGHCMAVTDSPCQLFWRELYEAYPDAKIILTVRDSPDQWAQSIEGSIKAAYVDTMYNDVNWYEKILRYFYPVSGRLQHFEKLLVDDTPFFKAIRAGEAERAEYYKAHNKAIEKAIPAENLLVMNVKEGWQPLCQFLEKDMPPWEFPKTNERKAFCEAFAGYSAYCRSVAERRLMWTVSSVLGGAAVVGAIIYRHGGLF